MANNATNQEDEGHVEDVPLKTLTKVFARIGLISFGGPAAQIALMQRELVDERPWLSEDQFLRALSFCMLLPGPEAMQLATYAGWRLRGVPGGLIAGGLFVLPGAIVIAALAGAYAVFGTMPLVEAAFIGIKAAVVVIVIQALWRLSKRALHGRRDVALAALAFLALFAFDVPYPILIGAAALWGAWRAKLLEDGTSPPPPDHASTLWTVVVWLALWIVPLMGLVLFGPELLARIGTFFSTLAVVTFGGAYAVLAYMSQTIVTDLGWVSTPEMLDSLGLAETTPGPLILVTEFVAFLAGYKEGGLGMAVAAALVSLWVTFVPCFLWIFVAAPWIEWITSRPRLRSALNAITASVVGVMLFLSVWLALHVFFENLTDIKLGPAILLWPDWTTLNLTALALTAGAGVLLFVFRLGLIPLIGLAACAGLAFA